MKAEQISIFLENKAGRLAGVTGTLSEAGVNIRALSMADTSDFGVLRLIVDDNGKAKLALKEKGFTVVEILVALVILSFGIFGVLAFGLARMARDMVRRALSIDRALLVCWVRGQSATDRFCPTGSRGGT